jgi:DNA repair protein RecO (recombination protein O)
MIFLPVFPAGFGGFRSRQFVSARLNAGFGTKNLKLITDIMQRDSCSEAVILTSKAAGGDHLMVTLFGTERGVYQAMLFGGRKSRLRALISPWHLGTVWLYGDTKKNMLKITDFEAVKFRSGIRDSLYKTWAASLASELVIKTNATGEYAKCWTLVNAFFDGLDQTAEDECRAALVRFLWRFLSLMGLCPPTIHCVRCGDAFSTTAAVYEPAENGFTCTSCAAATGSATEFSVSAEGLAYLSAVSELRFSDVRAIRLSASALEELKTLLFFLITQAAGDKLNTLASGAGIL